MGKLDKGEADLEWSDNVNLRIRSEIKDLKLKWLKHVSTSSTDPINLYLKSFWV